ncbi:MAG: hypothetical protein LLG00_02525 [Planctomycetaceae bacterium]|nr:hypothetical protein [Planctomycetaceae bacterium]
MKTFVRLAVPLVAITAVCQGSLALAEDAYWASSSDQPAASFISDQKAPAAKQPVAGSCCEQTSCFADPACGGEGDPRFALVGQFGFDAFKGISDSPGVSNFGAVTGFNSGWLLGESNFGLQLGMTYGVYDWDGRTAPTVGGLPTTVSEAKSQQQTFLTMGFFRKSDEDHPLSFGLVYDYMFNEQWGVYGTHPTLGQWRGQVEWAFSEKNGVGVWGCVRDRYADSTVDVTGGVPLTVTTRSVSQANMFWHHKFDYPAQTWLWVGAPQTDRLNGDESLYAWTFGGAFQAPITERLAWYGNFEYAHPSASAGSVASNESAWNVGTGILWYFGGGAHSHQLNGERATPYMPVANNSMFLVDQNP